MMSLWDALRMNMMISYQELVRTFLGYIPRVLYEKYCEVLRLQKIDVPFSLPHMEIFMIYNRSALNSSVFSRFIEQVSTK